VASGRPLRTVETSEMVSAVDLSPDGSRLAVGDSAGGVFVLATATGEELARRDADRNQPMRQIAGLTFLDPRELIVAVRGEISFHAERWTLGAELERRHLRSSNTGSGPERVALAPRSVRFAGATVGRVEVHDGTAELARLSMGLPSSALALSTGGALLAVADQMQTVRLYAIDERRERWKVNSGAVHMMTFDPTGALLAIGDAEGIVRIWDVQTGVMQRSFVAGRSVSALRFAPDGRLAVAAHDGEGPFVAIVDPATGERLRRLGRPGDVVEQLRFVGDRLAAAGPRQAVGASGHVATTAVEPQLALWDAASGAPIARTKTEAKLYQVCWTADGAHVAAVGVSQATILTAAGREVGRFPTRGDVYYRCVLDAGGILVGASAGALTAWSFDGTVRWSLARPSAQPRLIAARELLLIRTGELVELATGRVVRQIPSTKIAASADGLLLAAVMGDQIEIRRVADDKLVRRIPVTAGELVAQLAFGSKDHLAVVLNGDRTELWNVASGRLVHHFTGPMQAWGATLAEDGKRLLTQGTLARLGSQQVLWDARTGKELVWGSWDSELSVRGRRLLSFDGKLVALFDSGTAARLHVFPAAPPFALAPAADRFAAVDQESALGWAGEPRHRIGLAPLVALAVSPAGDQIAATDGVQVAMFEDGGRTRLWQRALPDVRYLQFASAGRLLAIAGAHAELLDTESGTGLGALELPAPVFGTPQPGVGSVVLRLDAEIGVLELAPLAFRRLRDRAGVEAAAVSPAGQLLLAGADNQLTDGDGRVLGGHEAAITAIAFHATAPLAATAARDRTVALWDLRAGKRLATLLGVIGGPELVVSEDGFVDGDPGEAGAQAVLSWKVGDVQLPGFVGWQRYHRPGLLAQVIGSVR
jgi:WD40 repeat protein